MSIFKTCLLLVLLLALESVVFSQSQKIDVQRIADGVYAAIRKEPPGLTTNANSVFIINSDHVVVVDTTLTPSSAQEVLTALRTLTDKPVRYVINTHWHDDHIMGNDVFRKAFPKAEFIAHKNTREYLPTTGLSNRKQAMSENGYPQFISALRRRLEKNESVFGGPMDAEERATYTSDVAIAEQYMAEDTTVEVVLPTITVEDQLTLSEGNRTIEIRYLGRAHTSGDLVINLPKEHVVIAGDVVIWPVPYVGGNQSHTGDWALTLQKLLDLHPAVIVPGHGPVLRDLSYPRLMIDLFTSIKQQVEASVARGETLDQIRKSINLDEFQRRFAGESRMRKSIFRNYGLGPAVEAAYRDSFKNGMK